jgi:hypothetical protein
LPHHLHVEFPSLVKIEWLFYQNRRPYATAKRNQVGIGALRHTVRRRCDRQKTKRVVSTFPTNADYAILPIRRTFCSAPRLAVGKSLFKTRFQKKGKKK